ncbi:hypothetical protein G7K_0562-t1 [Saitoella complicata NRRL Y-17804]|uniref:Glutamyl-tRNA amidotransferase complex subunit Gta3 domain-containing protein n=1 Tax=Saitoella complicata (strain BCRC 22490 / CBS 7301 / JCM 7358 / NBRC 10748 / NRRL Y-17804) TaxID=698492 RepID=A0A0E9NAA0_SAICN|nr:hypothetical protein G7K_0562-t1 [Saitoella complicata NRRL Y-17804]
MAITSQTARAFFRTSYSRSFLLCSGTRQLTTATTATSLPKPTWSVSSLLPDDAAPISSEITPERLRHLLKLAALSPPKDHEAESRMLKDLSDQLHFVKHVQQCDTTGVEPMAGIHAPFQGTGEFAGEEGVEVTFEQAEAAGKAAYGEGDEMLSWDPVKVAQKMEGRYYVVEGGLVREEEQQ